MKAITKRKNKEKKKGRASAAALAAVFCLAAAASVVWGARGPEGVFRSSARVLPSLPSIRITVREK